MARFTTRRMVVARRTDTYDFKNDAGEQVKGEKHVLVVLDPETNRAEDIGIKRESLGLFDNVAAGEVVDLDVDVFANRRGDRAILSVTAVAVR